MGKRQVKGTQALFSRHWTATRADGTAGLSTLDALLTHPRCGASWEGFALKQVLRLAAPDAAYFWATHNGAELDLLMFKSGQRVGVEFKRADAPGVTRSMQIAMSDLQLDRLHVVYPATLRRGTGLCHHQDWGNRPSAG